MIKKMASVAALTSILMATSVVASDYNNDGNADILFKTKQGDTKAWFMSRTAKLGQTNIAGKVETATVVAEGDFNNDGYRDMVAKNVDGTYDLWIMGAAGKVKQYLTGYRGWAIAGTGDFDGDSTTDILWRKDDGSLVAWYMNGAAKSSTQFITMSSAYGSFVGITDINNDGKDDIIVRKNTNFVALTMDITGKTGSQFVGTNNNGEKIVGLGDFDGNGYGDVLVKKANGERVIWYMGAAGKISNLLLTGARLSDWTAQDVEDYNNDGFSDVLFTKGNGDVLIWFMNAGGVLGKLNVTPDNGWTFLPQNQVPATKTLSGIIAADTTLTADTVWLLDGEVRVLNNAVLTVEPGTTVAGKSGTEGWLIVEAGSRLEAAGTATEPILFTSEEALYGQPEAPAQWGGVTLIGNAGTAQTTAYEVDGTMPGYGVAADNSGTLTYCTFNNTGIAVLPNKEINGLSLVGVGSGTTIDNITVNRSGDDGIEIWGGYVNLTNITIDGAQDDSFDTDQGWEGSVDGLTITNGLYAGIEMSGTSHADYRNVSITLCPEGGLEGGLYFKAGSTEDIGGYFTNVVITNNSASSKGAINSKNNFDPANASFTNVRLKGINLNKFTGTDATEIETTFNAGSGNVAANPQVVKSGIIVADETWTVDTDYILDGEVRVLNGATLTIEPGTIVAGKQGSTGWLIVEANSTLEAAGTACSPILFTSEDALLGLPEAPAQWGGVTVIGNAGTVQTSAYEVDGTMPGYGNMTDNSGTMTNLILNNTGIAVLPNKEINGLSLVGVGSGTTIDNIKVNRSGDDGIEIWGGSVNLTNITIDGAQDDSFDTDQGWIGSVDGLTITNGLYAGIEMSGTTHATYKNVNIQMPLAGGLEGGLYFKAGSTELIGGHFENVVVVNDSNGSKGNINSKNSFDNNNSSFTNVSLSGTNPARFTGTDAALIEATFDLGTGNTK